MHAAERSGAIAIAVLSDVIRAVSQETSNKIQNWKWNPQETSR